MADDLAGFSVPFGNRIVKAVEKIERMPVDLRPRPRRQTPDEDVFEIVNAVIVCFGPNGDPADPPFTDERYWIQVASITAAADPEDAAVFDSTGGTIHAATNIAETGTHTHGLRVGTVVEAWPVVDEGGVTRWIFFA